jgi:ketosteroid isomerase-like protein
MKTSISTKEIIQQYYNAINNKGDWQSLISDDIEFTGPGQITHSKEEYVKATERFLQVVKSLKINEFIVEDNKACITVEYNLQSASGKTTTCEVAEVLMVKDDKINSSCIFFDTAAFRSFIAQG